MAFLEKNMLKLKIICLIGVFFWIAHGLLIVLIMAHEILDYKIVQKRCEIDFLASFYVQGSSNSNDPLIILNIHCYALKLLSVFRTKLVCAFQFLGPDTSSKAKKSNIKGQNL